MQNSLAESSLLFRCQFIAGPAAIRHGALGNMREFAGLHISAHPALNLNSHAIGDVEVLCLGYLLDPENIDLGTSGIIESLVARIRGFAEFERLTAPFGGRWLMFVRIGTEVRLYPDATGMKPAFYVNTTDGGTWMGSQPLLLADVLRIQLDRQTAETFLSASFQNSWPGEVTPYSGVRQLLPNHYLDVNTGVTHRFWPREQLEPTDMETAVHAICSTLHRLMQSAGATRRLALGISGGHDSRALLACGGDLRQAMDVFTLYSPGTEFYDIEIPRKLANRIGITHRVLRVRPPDDDFWEAFKANTSYMFSDPSDVMAYTFNEFSRNTFVLSGHAAEIIRCFYYPDGKGPPRIVGADLARMAGFDGNAVAIDSFSRWLAGVPPGFGINILDLFYWEHRIGNWGAMVTTGLDMTCDVIPLFNCRSLLMAGLATDVRSRAEPYPLFRRLCEYAEPITVSVPFNWSIWENAQNMIQKHVSWRLWSLVHEKRMQRAGLGGWTKRIEGKSAMHELLQQPCNTTRRQAGGTLPCSR